jgi:hypothetical protein
MISVEKQIGAASDSSTPFLAVTILFAFQIAAKMTSRGLAAAMALQKNICRPDQTGSIPPSLRNFFE